MFYIFQFIYNYFFKTFELVNRPLTHKQYWEEEVEKDDWEWIKDEEDWEDYFNNKENDTHDIKFINYENKGFVLIKDYTKSYGWYHLSNCRIHIHFAFVCLKHRKKGILKKMIDDIKIKYNNNSISLESVNEFTDKVWERLDFKCHTKRKTLSDYLYKEKMD